MKRRPVRRDADRTKVIITARLDADIVDYFKLRAEKPGAPGYQTQINDALRAFMESGGATSEGYTKLVDNEQFINAVAARVRSRSR
jgi:hypothetical protein